jgi:hypothetical protein
MAVRIPPAFKGYFDNVLKKLLNRNWGYVPEIHAPSATYNETKDCNVNAKNIISTYGASGLSFFRTKYYKTFPNTPILKAARRNGAGGCHHFIQKATYVPLQGICLKASKCDF